MRGIRRAAVLSVLLLGASASSACYTVRAQAPGVVPNPETEGKVVWSFAWGLVQATPQITNCNEAPLSTVTTKNNFGFALLTVVTLGLVSPMRIEWNCAGDDPAPHPFEIGGNPAPE